MRLDFEMLPRSPMNLPLESYELESPRRLIMAAVETMPVADPVGQEKVPTLPDGAACVH